MPQIGVRHIRAFQPSVVLEVAHAGAPLRIASD